MNATTKTETTAKQIKAQLEDMRIAFNKSQKELKEALKQKSSKSLRAESTKTANSYHFSMSEFKDYVFKNKELFKDFIISDDDNEMLVKSTFKHHLMTRIIKALNLLDDSEKL